MASTFGSLANLYSQERGRQVDANLTAAGLQQRDRQFNDSLAQQRAEFEAQHEMRGFEAAQRSADVANHAVAQSWLNQQELSQQDVMRRQQLGSAVAAVEAERGKGLTDAQANDMIVQLKTKIDPLDARMKMSQQRHMDSQNKLLDEQAGRMAHQRQAEEAFNAAAMNDTFQFVPDQTARPGVVEEVADAAGLPPTHPEVQKRVDELMRERGLGQRFFMNGGKKEMHPADLEALKNKSKLGEGRGPREVTAEEHARTMMEMRREVDRWADKQEKVPSEADREAEYQKRMKQHAEGMAKFREERDSKGKPRVDAEATRVKATKFDEQYHQLAARPDLPAPLRAAALAAVATGKRLIQKYHDPELMPPEVRGQFDRAERIVKSLPPDPARAQATQDAPTGAGQAAGGILRKAFNPADGGHPQPVAPGGYNLDLYDY
jgi:hypothetical protein